MKIYKIKIKKFEHKGGRWIEKRSINQEIRIKENEEIRIFVNGNLLKKANNIQPKPK